MKSTMQPCTHVNVRARTSPPGGGLTYGAMRDVVLTEACNGEGWDVVDVNNNGTIVSVYSFDVSRVTVNPTPGPWVHAPEGDETVVGIPLTALQHDLPDVDGPVLQSFSVLGESEVASAEDYANAQLIAAAPELLAMLREIADKSRVIGGYTSSSALTLKLASIGSMARAAIAKAVES